MPNTLRAADCLLLPCAMVHMLGQITHDRLCPAGVDTVIDAGGSPGINGMPAIQDDGNYYLIPIMSTVVVIGNPAPTGLNIKPDLGANGALGSGPRTQNIIDPRLLVPNTTLWIQSVWNFPTGTPQNPDGSQNPFQFTVGYKLVKGQVLNPAIFCNPTGAPVTVTAHSTVTWVLLRATDGWAGN